MTKIDEYKESLNTLRVGFTILFGLLVLLIGALVTKVENNNIGWSFWAGSTLSVLAIIGLAVILREIAKKTKEIGEL
jgi:Na+/melibiose symporter-like transporter